MVWHGGRFPLLTSTMKLSPLPLSLLLLLPLHTTAEVQAPLQRYPGVHATRRTLVDALSADPDNYSHLLRLLQRTRLIPTLNRLNGSVLFAPTNDAIERHASKSHLWGNVFQVIAQESYDMLDESELETRDNVNEELRQELLYHLVNYNVTLPDSGKIDVLETLHYPRKQIDPPTKEPPPGPPWFPIPGGTLGGESQRLRVSGGDKGQKVGVDYRGKGGSKVIKSEDGGNGLLVAVDEVLSVPQDLGAVFCPLMDGRMRAH
jgi:solute carrier family 25 carnitine/acylcarnitine transporter 20/29